MTLLGIDYGTSRIGLALAKASVASPLETLNTHDINVALQSINRYVVENKVDKIVVGLPLTADGKETPFAREIKRFGKQLKILTKRPVVYQNEYGTSSEALEEAVELGISKKDRQTNDHIAAALILENFLEQTT